MTQKEVGDLFDKMLDELEALNIEDARLPDFSKKWDEYLLKRLNYTRKAAVEEPL